MLVKKGILKVPGVKKIVGKTTTTMRSKHSTVKDESYEYGE